MSVYVYKKAGNVNRYMFESGGCCHDLDSTRGHISIKLKKIKQIKN